MYIRIVLCLIGLACFLESSQAAKSPKPPKASKEAASAEPTPPKSSTLEDGDTIALVEQLIESIKKDSSNLSYDQMIREQVMSEHTLNNHKPNAPYFYSNDRYVITDIIELVLDDPDGVIDETASSGQLKIYRESVYPVEIEHFFDREKRITPKVQDPKHDFQNNYPGQTVEGPTNKVMVTLLVKGDEQNLDTLEKRLKYLKNNIRYIDAYPVKGSAVVPKPGEVKSEESKTAEEAAGEGEQKESVDGEAKSKESKTEEGEPEDSDTEEGKAKKTETEDAKPEKEETEDSDTEESEAKNPKTGTPKADRSDEGE